MNCTGRDRITCRRAGQPLAACLLLAASLAGAAEPARYGYCTWAVATPAPEAVVSAVYEVPARAGSVRLARSFADYIDAGRRDRPRPFTPVCFREFESEDAARQQRNREVAGYRQRGFTVQVVGGWRPGE